MAPHWRRLPARKMWSSWPSRDVCQSSGFSQKNGPRKKNAKLGQESRVMLGTEQWRANPRLVPGPLFWSTPVSWQLDYKQNCRNLSDEEDIQPLGDGREVGVRKVWDRREIDPWLCITIYIPHPVQFRNASTVNLPKSVPLCFHPKFIWPTTHGVVDTLAVSIN